MIRSVKKQEYEDHVICQMLESHATHVIRAGEIVW